MPTPQPPPTAPKKEEELYPNPPPSTIMKKVGVRGLLFNCYCKKIIFNCCDVGYKVYESFGWLESSLKCFDIFRDFPRDSTYLKGQLSSVLGVKHVGYEPFLLKMFQQLTIIY